MLDLINDILQDRKIMGGSTKWANWECKLLLTSCKSCVDNHGKIFDIKILEGAYEKAVKEHYLCKCYYFPMRVKNIGTVTDKGANGADVYIMIFGKLPDNYIKKEEAINNGWKGNLSKVLPGKSIGGDIFKNRDLKLPIKNGRIWYEADINYNGGYRGRDRILYSNDGLMFVSYDHYQTFYEITA